MAERHGAEAELRNTDNYTSGLQIGTITEKYMIR